MVKAKIIHVLVKFGQLMSSTNPETRLRKIRGIIAGNFRGKSYSKKFSIYHVNRYSETKRCNKGRSANRMQTENKNDQ